jgi:hypothetical protein
MSVNVNLLAKKITWPDGSTELVAIDRQAYIWRNRSGVFSRGKEVGFQDSLDFAAGNYATTGNLTMLDAELTVLQAAGVRLISPTLWYHGPGNEGDYDKVLQLYQNHKMFLIPEFTVLYAAGNLSNPNFIVAPSETVSQIFTNWLTHILASLNVIAIIIETELDLYVSGGNCTQAAVTAYYAELYAIAKSMTSLPLLTKFSFRTGNTGAALATQHVLRPYSAITCFDIYDANTTTFAASLSECLNWSMTYHPQYQLWLPECGYNAGSGDDYSLLTVDMINTMLTKASVALLYTQNSSQNTAGSFFDTSGNAKANTTTLLSNLPTWQAPC